MNMGVVQYFVFKRPKTPNGRVIYGAELAATKDPLGRAIYGETLLMNVGKPADVPSDHLVLTKEDAAIRNQITIPESEWEPVIGEPWILHSTHFGVNEALEKAKPLVISLGLDNVKICKLLPHDIDVRMA